MRVKTKNFYIIAHRSNYAHNYVLLTIINTTNQHIHCNRLLKAINSEDKQNLPVIPDLGDDPVLLFEPFFATSTQK